MAKKLKVECPITGIEKELHILLVFKAVHSSTKNDNKIKKLQGKLVYFNYGIKT